MKSKRIFLINGSANFEKRFIQSCVEKNIEGTTYKTRDFSIIATTEGYKLYNKNSEISIKDISYCFIRLKGKMNHMTALFAYLLSVNNIPFNDELNIEHSLSSSKITQAIRFSHNNIPIPKTIICSVSSYEKNKDTILEQIHFPCVLKTKGSKGDSVWKINDEVHLEKILLNIKEQLVLIQEFIPNHSDIRAVFFEEEYIGAIERSSIDGFYNNVSKGGHAQTTQISNEEKELCIKAIKISKLDFAGADFVRTQDGIKFFEVNKSPQIKGLEIATKIDIVDALVSKINTRFQ